MLDKNLVRLLQNLYEQKTDGADYEFAIDIFAEIEEMSRGELEDIVFLRDSEPVSSDYEDIFDDDLEVW